MICRPRSNTQRRADRSPELFNIVAVAARVPCGAADRVMMLGRLSTHLGECDEMKKLAEWL